MLTLALTEVSLVMPTTIEDLTYTVLSYLTVALLGLVVALMTIFGKKICSKVDTLTDHVSTLFTKEAVNEQKINDHIENSGVHCKGHDCPMRALTPG